MRVVHTGGSNTLSSVVAGRCGAMGVVVGWGWAVGVVAGRGVGRSNSLDVVVGWGIGDAGRSNTVMGC